MSENWQALIKYGLLFSAYVPLGPKYATCLRMINLKKKRDQISIGGI